MSPKYAKSPVGCLTSETSAVVCLGLAQTGRWGIFPHTSKKLNAVAMTTAVDHGKMIFSIFFKLAGDPNSSISDEKTFCFDYFFGTFVV